MTGYRKKQSGVALIIGLIMLLLLSIIMINAVQVTTLEERMARNTQNHNIAFQSAESALREAEAYIQRSADGNDPVNNPFFPLKLYNGTFMQSTPGQPCVHGLCAKVSLSDPVTFPDENDADYANQVGIATTGIASVSAEPEYIIELIRIDPGPDSGDSSRVYATFRITARANGGDTNTLVQLQSTYKVHLLSSL